MVLDLDNDIGLSHVDGNNQGQDSLQAIRIKARRDIVTEFGFIKAGEVGYVTKSWIQRIISGGCGCNGSTNWFTYVYH